MPRNYSVRTLVSVKINHQGTELNYGFNSGLKDSLRSDFGQLEITTALPKNFCFGANSPKPGRASKKTTTGIVGSFCADEKRSALRKSGYSVTRKKVRGVQTDGLAPTYYVTIGGIKYAWYLTYMTGQVLPSDLITAAGVKKAKADEQGLVFGADFPRPPRYAREVTINGNPEKFTTFIDPEKASTIKDWKSVEPSRFYPI